MTEQDSQRSRATSVIGYGLALALAVLGLVARAVVAHDEGNSWVDVISALLLIVAGTLLLVFALFEMFAWFDRVRIDSEPAQFSEVVEKLREHGWYVRGRRTYRDGDYAMWPGMTSKSRKRDANLRRRLLSRASRLDESGPGGDDRDLHPVFHTPLRFDR